MKKCCALLLALTLLLLLCACGKTPEEPVSEPDPSDTTAPAVTEANTAVHDVVLPYTAADSLNPFQTKSAMNRDICTLLYDSLVRLDEHFMPVLSLAAAIRQEGLKLTVALRSDAQFTTGDLLQARDVIRSFECAKESPCYEARLATFESCSLSGEEVVFTLAQENVQAEGCLDFPIVKFGTEETEIPIGSGRYRLYHRDADLYLDANETGSAREEMELKTIKLLDISTRENELQLMQIGEMSALYVDPTTLERTKIFAGEEIVPMLNLVFLGLNSDRPYLQDAAFRCAIAAALDKPTLVSTAYDGYASATDAPFHPLWGNSDLPDVTFDPQAAPGQLDALGCLLSSAGKRVKEEETVTLELVCNSENKVRMACAELIRQQLEDCGFGVNLSSLDYDSYLARLESGQYDLYVGEVKLTADMNLSMFFAEDGAAGYGISSGSASAKAYDDWRDGTAETTMFAQVFLQDQPFVPLCFRSSVLYYAKELQVEGGVCENDLFGNLYAWSYGA